MQKFALSDFTLGIDLVVRDPKVRVATVFQTPIAREIKKVQRVRVTRHGKNSLLVTYGRVNFRDREFLKQCKKAKCQPKKYLLQFKKEKKAK